MPAVRNLRRFLQDRVSMTLTGVGRAGATVALVLLLAVSALAQSSRYTTTDSRSQYVHWISLYDANKKKIDPDDPNSPPYSPAATCGKCHDYKAMVHGYHFNATDPDADPGRPGEPWIWTDARTGTQIPFSYRGWPGTYKPDVLGVSTWKFVLKFGRHMPGGGPGEGLAGKTAKETAEGEKPTQEENATQADQGRWRLAGRLEVDCMLCHSNDRSYSPEVWNVHVTAENFAWAATAAMGLAKIEGSVKRLPDDFDPAAAASNAEKKDGPTLPRTIYNQYKFNAEKEVFFDIARKPPNNACYHCHTVRQVGEDAAPKWVHDEDIHLEAGLTCVDCHRNGLGHHTVRGFESEKHPTGQSVATLSCRGCHMNEHSENGDVTQAGGRFGAPQPLHKGLPPLHLQQMSCTSCHSGPAPREAAGLLQTSMAHELGLRAHRTEDLPPGIVSPVFLRNGDGILYPYRMMWPAFWGALKNEKMTPLNPDKTYAQLRRSLRVRKNFTKEMAKVRITSEDKAAVLGDERAKVDESELSEDEKIKLQQLAQTKGIEAFFEKLAKGLQTLAKGEIDGTPVYVSGGKAYRLGANGKVEAFEHESAKPYAWPLAHDVRPARWSLGSHGCVECHSDGAPMFYGSVTAEGPAPDNSPVSLPMHKLQKLDANLLAVWNQSFGGREAFKWVSFVSVGAVALLLLLFLLIGINGLFRLARRGKAG